MIELIEDNICNFELLYKANPFGCRIKSLFDTYSPQLPFVDFWVQLCDGRPATLIARLESAFILRLSENSDIEEISSFLRVSGVASVICDGKYSLEIPFERRTGYILLKDNEFITDNDFEVITPKLKEVYDVIKQCSGKNFSVPDYQSFMLDVSHKLNSKTVRIFGVRADNTLKSCVMTLAETDDCAVLGALATVADSRNCGYGTYLIEYITNTLLSENKKVFLHRAKDENIDFYNNLGFENYGKWAEYSLKE